MCMVLFANFVIMIPSYSVLIINLLVFNQCFVTHQIYWINKWIWCVVMCTLIGSVIIFQYEFFNWQQFCLHEEITKLLLYAIDWMTAIVNLQCLYIYNIWNDFPCCIGIADIIYLCDWFSAKYKLVIHKLLTTTK